MEKAERFAFFALGIEVDTPQQHEVMSNAVEKYNVPYSLSLLKGIARSRSEKPDRREAAGTP